MERLTIHQTRNRSIEPNRRAANELLQKRVRAVGELQEADVGDDSEAALDERQQARQHEAGQREDGNEPKLHLNS